MLTYTCHYTLAVQSKKFTSLDGQAESQGDLKVSANALAHH